MEYHPDAGAGIFPRLNAERKAGLYLWDVLISGTSTALDALIPNKFLDPLEPTLILPEVKESKYWRCAGVPRPRSANFNYDPDAARNGLCQLILLVPYDLLRTRISSIRNGRGKLSLMTQKIRHRSRHLPVLLPPHLS